MKKLIIIILLTVLFVSCVTVNIYTKPTTIKQYQNNAVIDSLMIDSSWY